MEALQQLQDAVHHFLHSTLATLQAMDPQGSSHITCTLKDLKVAEEDNKAKAFLRGLFVEDARLGLFYLNPKLHKESEATQWMPLKCPCRPIISMVGHPVSKLAFFMHSLLAPTLHRDFIPDYLKDTPDLLREL